MPRTEDKTPEWLVSLMHTAINDGFTQRSLATIMGVTQPNISKYLSRKQAPSINAVEKFLKHMGGDVSRALPGYSGPDAPPILEFESVNIEGNFEGTQIQMNTRGTPHFQHAKGHEVEVRVVLIGKAVMQTGGSRAAKRKPFAP